MLNSINSKNNILFFGATGKLGSYWIKNLALKNTIFCHVHIKNKLPKLKNIKKIKLNLINSKDICLFCQKNNISLIINCIGLANVDFCEVNKKKAYNTNYKIPSDLCKVAKKINIPFVHISTDMLFNGRLKKKYSETNSYSPINQYSSTKVKAEKYILKYNKSLIIRSNFFGFGEKNNQTFSDKIIFEQKLSKKTYLWKNVYFTPMYIPNLVFFINLLINNQSSGIFNVSSDLKISKYAFGMKLIKKIIKNKNVYSNNFDKKKFTKRPNNMALSNLKLKKKFFKYKNKLKLQYQINSFVKDYKLLNG